MLTLSFWACCHAGINILLKALPKKRSLTDLLAWLCWAHIVHFLNKVGNNDENKNAGWMSGQTMNKLKMLQ